MTRRILNRRNVLTGAAAVIAGGSVASALACRPDAESAALELQLNRLRVALADIVAPDRIGRAYRQDRTASELREEFFATPSLRIAARHDCPAALRAYLHEQVRAEFQTGDVVVADRFVVARSECILAGLLA